MAITLNLRETIKNLVLAPALSFLSYIGTEIVSAYAIQIGALPSSASNYPLAVASVIFAIVIILGLDDMITSEDKDTSK